MSTSRLILVEKVLLKTRVLLIRAYNYYHTILISNHILHMYDQLTYYVIIVYFFNQTSVLSISFVNNINNR